LNSVILSPTTISWVIRYARDIACENRQEMEPDACIAIDDSWDNRRKAGIQFTGVINCGSGRVIDFEIAPTTEPL
jgi:hypothetical protein